MSFILNQKIFINMFQYLFIFIPAKLNRISLCVFLIVLLSSNIVFVYAQTSYPVPAANKNMLFYLQRTFNKNTIVFELNWLKNNTLNLANPVNTYWIRYEENSQKADLTKIQQMLFGLKCIPINNSNSSFLLVNKKIEKLKIKLEKSNAGDYKAFMNINNQKSELERVFIKTEENSIGLSVNVKYIEVSGISTENRKQNTERILM